MSTIHKSIQNIPEVTKLSYQTTGAYILLPIWFFNISDRLERERIFYQKSAFIVYHWESFRTINNSYKFALASQYNNAYVLLRCALETVIRGTFFQCLTMDEFLYNSKFIDRDKKAKKLIDIIKGKKGQNSRINQELGNVSAGIYDLISSYLNKKKYQPLFSTILKQIIEWNFLVPSEHSFDEIYKELYASLSKNVHILPDYTDIAKAFENEPVSPYQLVNFNLSHLKLYLKILNQIMDINSLLVVNLLKNNLEYPEVHQKVKIEYSRDTFQTLPLQYTKTRLHELL